MIFVSLVRDYVVINIIKFYWHILITTSGVYGFTWSSKFGIYQLLLQIVSYLI